jgi:hypothetical protein
VRPRPTYDPNVLEIGLTDFISLLLFDGYTQNLTMVYKIKRCNYAYAGEISSSNGEIIPYKPNFLIEKSSQNVPQSILFERYKNHEFDDQVNYMIVERCDGDL